MCCTEAVGVQCVVVLCSSRPQAWWLVTRMGPDHHMHMCHRSQHRHTHTSKQKHTTIAHTHYNMVCLCGDFVGTCACNDSRSGCVTTGHVIRRSPNFTPPFSVTVPSRYTHCRLSYHMALLHLHWVLSHNNISRTTMQSLLATAMGNCVLSRIIAILYEVALPRWGWDEWIV